MKLLHPKVRELLSSVRLLNVQMAMSNHEIDVMWGEPAIVARDRVVRELGHEIAASLADRALVRQVPMPAIDGVCFRAELAPMSVAEVGDLLDRAFAVGRTFEREHAAGVRYFR